ncbi:MAG: sulfatase-like hydrolase/transferase [Verrucomicrobiota bacterium]
MKLKPFRLTLLITLIASSFAASSGAQEKPNVIVIIADDIGYADVGFHDIVADGVETPNLDRLAASGVTFLNGYASSPICSNSRLALSTGRYQHRWGAYYYGQGGLPTTEHTIAEMMREAGYRTMKVGKTHLNRGPKSEPLKHGFDRYLGFKHHSWDFNMLSEKDVEAYERKQEGSHKRATQAPFGPLTRDDGKLESFEDTTTTEVFGKESVEFIEEESSKPFYLQLEFNAVHTPLIRAPEKYRAKYGIPERPFDRNAKVWEYPLWDPVAQPDFKEWYGQTCHLEITDPYGRKIYLAHLELMDEMIGDIIDVLKKQGQWENTIIYFTADNGGSDQSYANNGPLNAYKYCLMDGGIKVPMVISWPREFKAGERIEALVTHRDLYASLSEITGIPPKKPLDGKSLLPLIAGDIEELHTEPMYWDSGNRQNNWVVRHGDWKLVYRKEEKIYDAYVLGEDGLVEQNFRKVPIPAGLQLYNLGEDPGETNDLSFSNPEKVASMERLYHSWRAQMSDPIRGVNAK